MVNTVGSVYGLTVLTPIVAGKEQELQSYLAGLPEGSESPLITLGRTHFARWVIIPQLIYQGPPQKRDSLKSQYLLFESNFDGDLDTYLDQICARIPDVVNGTWGNCVACPGVRDPLAFKSYMRHNQIDVGLLVAAYADATVDDVLAALATQEKIVAFAIQAQGLEAGALHELYRNTFAPGGVPV